MTRLFYVHRGDADQTQPIFVTGGATTLIRLFLEADATRIVMPSSRGRFEIG